MEFGIGGGQAGRLPAELSLSQIDAFVDLGERHHIQTPFCCLENDFTLPAADDHDRMLRQTLEQIEQAGDCGATHVRLFAGFTPAAAMTEPVWRRLLDALHLCDDLCRALHMTLAIETHGRITVQNGAAHHEHTVTTDRTGLQRLLDELPPTVTFNYDPGNLKAVAPDDTRYGLDLLDARIDYCHLKDWRRRGEGWEAVAIGDDDLDYATLLKQMTYRGVYLIEYEPTEDVEAGIQRSLEYLTRCGIQWQF
ncbi:sugar phosphate isomerase/epimerase [Planctomycetales bacterium ZRK34]|nr:sugar phosphate isomerase/epimerase [Planctomycetales bacterium ZRK34]